MDAVALLDAGWLSAEPGRDIVGAMTRTKIAVGSIVGALVLHVVMVACGSAPPSMAGDAGVLADVRDAIVDALHDVVDAETPDAHAGGDGGIPPTDGGAPPADGGAPACNCPAPPRPEYSFSGGAVDRGGASLAPVADFSTATVGVVPTRADDGTTFVTITANAGYRLSDGASAYVQCDVHARVDGTVIVRATDDGGTYDSQCFAFYRSGSVVGSVTASAPMLAAGARVVGLSQERAEVTLPSVRVRLTQSSGGMQMPAGEAVIAPVTVRAFVPGAAWLTPPRAYRP